MRLDRVAFTTAKGQQKIVIGQAAMLEGVDGAVDARNFIEESRVPKGSRDDFQAIVDQLDALHHPRTETLQFYCDLGMFRSGTMAALYMVRHLNYTPEEAFAELELELQFGRVYGSWGDQVRDRVWTWLLAFEQLVMGKPKRSGRDSTAPRK